MKSGNGPGRYTGERVFQERGTCHAKALRPACAQVCLANSKKASMQSRVNKGECGREGAVRHTGSFGFYPK